MSKSARLRSADWATLYTLVGECRELGDDPVVWRRHLFGRLGQLSGADLVVGGEVELRPGGAVSTVGTVEWGWENGFDRARFLKLMADHGAEMRVSPILSAYFGSEPGTLPALTRTDLVSDADWYRSRYYQMAHSQIGLDHALVTFVPLPGQGTALSGLTLSRPRSIGRDFRVRDRQLVHEAHCLLAGWIGGPLAGFAEPSPSGLPPRPRQVLRCLLEGDGDKQIACRLALSPHTVNQYTKLIYRHFGVTSRAELLARWVRRGWGATARWANSVVDASTSL